VYDGTCDPAADVTETVTVGSPLALNWVMLCAKTAVL
jgi:hypothetical protein